MLTDLHQALLRQLAPLEVPAYLADCIPDSARFPYIAAMIKISPRPGDAGSITLQLWCRGGSANADRFRLTDALLARLPARGLRLTLPHGTATLRLQSEIACIGSKDTLGIHKGGNPMKINWKVRLRNKTWLTAVIALIIGFFYDLLAMVDFVPPLSEDWLMSLLQTVLTLLTALGVVIDPTTDGAADSDRAMNY